MYIFPHIYTVPPYINIHTYIHTCTPYTPIYTFLTHLSTYTLYLHIIYHIHTSTYTPHMYHTHIHASIYTYRYTHTALHMNHTYKNIHTTHTCTHIPLHIQTPYCFCSSWFPLYTYRPIYVPHTLYTILTHTYIILYQVQAKGWILSHLNKEIFSHLFLTSHYFVSFFLLMKTNDSYCLLQASTTFILVLIFCLLSSSSHQQGIHHGLYYYRENLPLRPQGQRATMEIPNLRALSRALHTWLIS